MCYLYVEILQKYETIERKTIKFERSTRAKLGYL